MAIGDPFYQPPVLQPMFMPDEEFFSYPTCIVKSKSSRRWIYAAMRNNPAVVPLGNPEDDFMTGPMGVPQNVPPAPALVNSAQASTPAMALPMRRPDTKPTNSRSILNSCNENNTPPPALGRSQVNAPQSRGVLFSTPDQGRRSNTMLSVQRPDLGIGTNEMLMRVGGAGLANAGQGGLAAYGAMFDQYGNIQDQRRTKRTSRIQCRLSCTARRTSSQDALEDCELKSTVQERSQTQTHRHR